MNNRKELINAIAVGDVKRLKKLRNDPDILTFMEANGKYKFISLCTEYDQREEKYKDLSLAQIEELKKDHCVCVMSDPDPTMTDAK